MADHISYSIGNSNNPTVSNKGSKSNKHSTMCVLSSKVGGPEVSFNKIELKQMESLPDKNVSQFKPTVKLSLDNSNSRGDLIVKEKFVRPLLKKHASTRNAISKMQDLVKMNNNFF